MKKNLIVFVCLICPFLFSGSVMAQSESIPFSSDKWDYDGATVTPGNYKGKSGIHLLGAITLKDVDFANGTIEVDINFKEERNFPGILFRGGEFSIENFYVRPHQSGNPDANQYTPVFNGTAGWQFYHGKEYSKPLVYEFDEWHHIKIELAGPSAKIYFDNMVNPIISVPKLKTEVSSGALVVNGGRVPVWFANFKITPSNETSLGLEEVKPEIHAGTVKSWMISDVLTDSLFESKQDLDRNLTQGLNWKKVGTESSGILNLSKYISRKDGHNTAIAKLSIPADRDETRKFTFGFSDFVTVYLNGQILFQGGDNFRSRDYRFLGTVGYYDALYLPLKKGYNELMMIVRENFGGWGVKAILE